MIGRRTIRQVDGHYYLTGTRGTDIDTNIRRRNHRCWIRNRMHLVSSRHQRVPTVGDINVRRVHTVQIYCAPTDSLSE